MGIFDKAAKMAQREQKVVDEKVQEPAQEEVKEETKITPEKATESPAAAEKKFKVKFAGKKHIVTATSEEEAKEKVKNYYKVENTPEPIKITVKDIFNAIAEEINRIITVAHPETATNDYDRWVSVITEELGEIVHEVNDQYEGKRPTKNMYVECVQLAAATILLAKKYAQEHTEMFKQEK